MCVCVVGRSQIEMVDLVALAEEKDASNKLATVIDIQVC